MNAVRLVMMLLVVVCVSLVACRPVTIDVGPVLEFHSFTPQEGKRGSLVTIRGRLFSLVKHENRVWFGNVEAAILDVNPEWMTVVVPDGAETNQVTIEVNGIRSTSGRPFVVIQ